MPITVIRGKDAHTITRAELEAPIAGRRTVLDLGAGDGKWAYRRAQSHPEEFVIAIEPVRENVRESAAKAAKKPERGGLPNVLYVQASVEQLPSELRGIADDVYVTLPWGSLMRGLILADGSTLAAIASLCRQDASLRVVLNTRIFEEPVPSEARDLPEVTPDYIRSLAPKYVIAGLLIDDTRWMDADEVAALNTTWAKRLSHRAPPPSVYMLLRRMPASD